MTTEEVLVAKAKTLPPEGQREVLDFVEFLETRLGRGTPHKSLSGALADLGVDLSAVRANYAGSYHEEAIEGETHP
jgi:hypothetical protein